MPSAAIAVFLVVHGLITTAIGATAVSNPPAMKLPAFFDWWPGPFGRSWLFDALSLGSPGVVLGGLVWLASGVLLIGTGLGYLGFGRLRDAWPLLAVTGGGLGLVAIALYFHPLYVVAALINVALVATAWGRIGTAGLGS